MTPDYQWYIDAWSVIDGYAFASLRQRDSLEALATFFVSPPYFEPEPVASLATALAATRSHFQEGYRLGGEEVPFDSPEEVVEAVRRAYRAGGLDLNGTPLPEAPQPRPPRAGEAHPEAFVTDRTRAIWNDLRPWLQNEESRRDWPRRNFERLLALLIEETFPTLVPKFVGYAVLDMVAKLIAVDGDRGQAARELGAWIDRARAIGVDVLLGQEVVVAVRGMREGYSWEVPEFEQMSPLLVESLAPILYRTSGALLTEFEGPFIVPIPYHFQHAPSAGDVPPIPTVGHLLAVVSADRRYLSRLDSVLAFIPIIVGALIQLPARSLPHHGFPPVAPSPELRQLSATAARWLANSLASDRLRGHPAEETIHALVLRLLRRSNDDDQRFPAMGR